MKIFVAILIPIFFLSACSPSSRFAANRTTSKPTSNARRGSVIVGYASYYAHKFHGRKTANGEIYNMHDYTAAHRSLPFGTILLVTNLENNRTVKVRINDRGPFVKGRIIDLSLQAAKDIGLIKTGVAKVSLKVLKMGKNG